MTKPRGVESRRRQHRARQIAKEKTEREQGIHSTDLRAAEHLGDCCPDCDRLRSENERLRQEVEDAHGALLAAEEGGRWRSDR